MNGTGAPPLKTMTATMAAPTSAPLRTGRSASRASGFVSRRCTRSMAERGDRHRRDEHRGGPADALAVEADEPGDDVDGLAERAGAEEDPGEGDQGEGHEDGRHLAQRGDAAG